MLVSDDIREFQMRTIIPLLADYSSCYICYVITNSNKETILHYSPDDGFQKMHTSVELFFKTIITFYLKNVFYLNSEAFLDYDFERESIVGVQYNPGIDYWAQ